MTLSGIKRNKTLQNWKKGLVKDVGYSGILAEEKTGTTTFCFFFSVFRTEPSKTGL